MRKIIISIAILIFAGAVSLIRLLPAKPRPGPWTLANGATLSLAGVTCGTNHAIPYGNKIADFFYPVLSPRLRQKLGFKAVSFNTPGNEIAVWFWEKSPQGPPPNFNGQFRIMVMDDGGLETDPSMLGPFATAAASPRNDLLEGISLGGFPRRSREFTIRIYANDNISSLIGEFKVQNRLSTNFPVWKASPLPITVRTNNLEISLTAFENGTKAAAANINVSASAQPVDDWNIESIEAVSATGESRHSSLITPNGLALASSSGPAKGRLFTATFLGAFWHEEPAWKLKVELLRKANFPPEERWNIKSMPVPSNTGTAPAELTTNINGSEVGFSLMPSKETTRGRQCVHVPITLRLRSPLPAAASHLVLLQVKDENGRSIAFHRSWSQGSTGGRGATIRQLDDYYELDNAGSPRALDVMLAYTKSFFVEFMAKPAIQTPSTDLQAPKKLHDSSSN